MTAIACADCGLPSDGMTRPWTWSRASGDRGESLLCEACVRAHAHDIEAKLPDGWWDHRDDADPGAGVR